MLIRSDEAERIFSNVKRAPPPFHWLDGSKTSRDRLTIEVRVRFEDGEIPRGTLMRITAYPAHFHAFTFQLDCAISDNACSRIPLYRLEVNPLRAHTNIFIGPDNLHGLYFAAGCTHEHDFHDSLTKDGKLPKNPLAIARKVIVDPADFSNGLAVFCNRVNLVNGSDIPTPPSQGAFL